jgi:hypothetical protein
MTAITPTKLLLIAFLLNILLAFLANLVIIISRPESRGYYVTIPTLDLVSENIPIGYGKLTMFYLIIANFQDLLFGVVNSVSCKSSSLGLVWLANWVFLFLINSI